MCFLFLLNLISKRIYSICQKKKKQQVQKEFFSSRALSDKGKKQEQ